MNYLNELLGILNAMSPYLLLGFLFAGLLHAYLPKTTYNRLLAKRGVKSVALAALFGVPLPLCSCGVIPTAMSLKKEGASDGATVSFLIATPQTGIDSIMATYGVMGLPFAIVRPLVALVVGIMGGVVVDKFSGNNAIESGDQTPAAATSQPQRTGLVEALKYGFVDMLQDLGSWLVIGLVIAASITAFVPSSIFETLGQHYILNILVVLLLSIPMYICSTGSIPIAISLLMMGISPGAALVFLMAGPATNVATLTVLKRVLGGRTTLLYLASIIVGAIAFAVFIDFALPAEWFTAKLSAINTCSSHGGEGGGVWWHTASSILFVLLLINAYMLKFFKIATHSHGAEVAMVQRFAVTGMRCNHCKSSVERAITALPKVVSVTIEMSTGIVEVEGGVSADKVCKAVRPLGFEIAKL